MLDHHHLSYYIINSVRPAPPPLLVLWPTSLYNKTHRRHRSSSESQIKSSDRHIFLMLSTRGMLLVFKTYLSGGWWCLSNSTKFSKMLQFLKNTKIAKKILKKILEVLQACGFYRIPQMVKTTIGIVFNLFQDEKFQQFPFRSPPLLLLVL